MSINVQVVTNSFHISRLPTKEYHQYDVRFTPELNIASKRQRAIHSLQISVNPKIFNPRGVYDGKHLMYFSHQLKLPGGSAGTFTVRLGNDPKAAVGTPGVVQVVISKTIGGVIRPMDLNLLIQDGQKITASTATATNLLQLLIRQSSNQNNPTNNGRAYFSSQGRRSLPGTGVELWRGFFQSVRPTIGRMLVTIDTSMAAVYESGALLDIAMTILNVRDARNLSLSGPSGSHNLRVLRNHFKHRLITTKTTGERTKTVHDIIPGPIGLYPFIGPDGPITIEQHYLRAHNKRLSYPGAFGVRISGRNAPFEVIVPAELCAVLPGQLYKKRLPSSATTAAVGFATMEPQLRLQTISGKAGAVESPINGYRSSEFINDAGMVIETTPSVLPARILNAPEIQFKTRAVKPKDGSWNVMGQKFNQAASMKHWGVVSFEPRIRVDKVIGDLMECCKTAGMSVSHPTSIRQGEGHSVEKHLEYVVGDIREAAQKEGNLQAQQERRRPAKVSVPVDLILVLLPSKADEIRTSVKHWGDVKRGIRTSCLREDKLSKANNQYYNNVAIKLNARLGGHYALPNSIALDRLKSSPFIVMGADVAHPGPGTARPSIASLVWSWDQLAAHYVAFSAVQAPRLEIIESLQDMVEKAIFQFGKKNPIPSRIIFYRDGVSEGEIETVKNAEISAIQNACKKIWAANNVQAPLPTLTFIVVVKRHHTVFVPENPEDFSVADSTGNCRAGLVVDQLRSPLAKDFYLQSHGAIKGTSRSGHYSVLLDQNFGQNISAIQELSFALCHVYAKATRSISIPAPVYYADLVCARGKFHIDPQANLDFDASTNASGSEVFDLDMWRHVYQPVGKENDHDKGMYFL
ncbi:argonaute-like protein [Mycena rebaudengoi]|nr:argonaute-like protein [Mycena rebaudengoi]